MGCAAMLFCFRPAQHASTAMYFVVKTTPPSPTPVYLNRLTRFLLRWAKAQIRHEFMDQGKVGRCYHVRLSTACSTTPSPTPPCCWCERVPQCGWAWEGGRGGAGFDRRARLCKQDNQAGLYSSNLYPSEASTSEGGRRITGQ